MRLGVFGLGNMGAAFVRGIIAAGVLRADEIIGFDPYEGAGNELGIQRARSAREVAEGSDVWLLAVKPQGIVPLLQQHQSVGVSAVISLAAGVSLETLQTPFGGDAPLIIRTMSNIAAAQGKGATAWIANRSLSSDERATVENIIGSVGVAIELQDEKHMHAFTGAVGSGIAYLFLAAEAIADGAVAEGLPRPIARRAAAAAILGAGVLLDDGNEIPGDLKDRVCSPGGTTIEGIAALERGGVRAAFIDAVRTASQKSKLLAGE